MFYVNMYSVYIFRFCSADILLIPFSYPITGPLTNVITSYPKTAFCRFIYNLFMLL